MKYKSIVYLNPCDVLSLSIILWSALAIGLALHQQIELAIITTFMGMLADAMDGILARKSGTIRPFGRYLDGFMDMLLYLITPIVIWSQFQLTSFMVVPWMIFLAAGVIRLSVFNEIGNTEENNKLSYLGMPVFWSIFILSISFFSSLFINKEILALLLSLVLFGFSALMLWAKSFYKPQNIYVILLVVLYNQLIWLWLYFLRIQSFDISFIFQQISIIYVPLIVSGIAHMWVVKKIPHGKLTLPIHLPWFGKNKTWRGMLFVPLVSALIGCIMEWCIETSLPHLGWMGLVSGFGYMLFELPNSFMKRRCGIPEGESAAIGNHSMMRSIFFMLMDQLDSSFGSSFLLWIVFGLPAEICFTLFLMSPAILLFVKRILFIVRLKAKPH
jgi:phosphatidylserine synthase